MRPGEAEELSRLEFMAKLPCGSYNHKRTPRIRLRKGTSSLFITLGTRQTKRAAFRAARHLRDRHGEKRPQVVWKNKGLWHFGCRHDNLTSTSRG